MATKEVRICDVCERTKDVQSFLIFVREDIEAAPAPAISYDADLCCRCVKRLERFIERGVTAPKKKG